MTVDDEILVALGETLQGCTAYYLSKQFHMPRAQVSRALQRLKFRGAVEHVFPWRLTDAGRAALRGGKETGE